MGKICERVSAPAPESSRNVKSITNIINTRHPRVRQNGKWRTRTLKFPKRHRIHREGRIEEGLKTFTAAIAKKLAGSHQEVTTQPEQFRLVQPESFLKFEVKMNQDKFNIR